jgi:uncharacterized membrane protein HdeD (DUF308 family)
MKNLKNISICFIVIGALFNVLFSLDYLFMKVIGSIFSIIGIIIMIYYYQKNNEHKKIRNFLILNSFLVGILIIHLLTNF